MSPELSLEKIIRMTPCEKQTLRAEDLINLICNTSKPPDFSDKLNAIISKVDLTLEGISNGCNENSVQMVKLEAKNEEIIKENKRLLYENEKLADENNKLQVEIVELEGKINEILEEKAKFLDENMRTNILINNSSNTVLLHVENNEISEENIKLSNENTLLLDEIWKLRTGKIRVDNIQEVEVLQIENMELMEDNMNLSHDITILVDENKKLRTKNMQVEMNHITGCFKVFLNNFIYSPTTMIL